MTWNKAPDGSNNVWKKQKKKWMEGFLKCVFYLGRLGVEGSSFLDDSVQSEMAIQDCAVCVYLHNCNWILSHLWPSLSLRPFANWRRSIHTVRISLSLLPSCRLHSLSLSPSLVYTNRTRMRLVSNSTAGKMIGTERGGPSSQKLVCHSLDSHQRISIWWI